MKTYDEVIKMIAENVFDDEMSGGHGQFKTANVAFIFDVPDSDVTIDVEDEYKKISDAYCTSNK